MNLAAICACGHRYTLKKDVYPTERGFQFILSKYIITLFEVVTISLDNLKGDRK